MKKIIGYILLVISILCIVGIIALIVLDQSKDTSYNTSTTQIESTKITLDKFNQIKTGMTYEEVVEIIGEEGTVLSEVNLTGDEQYHTIIYNWKAKNNIANANITFQAGKVVSKAQMGLE